MDESYVSTAPLLGPPPSGGPPLPQEQYYGGGTDYDSRKPNFPPFRPCVHHNIEGEQPLQHRYFIKKAYFGWYYHSFALIYNFICIFGAVVKDEVSVGTFFIGLTILIAGVPVSFIVYWFLYSAVRKASAGLFLLWFIGFVIQICAEFIFGLGINGTGGAGFVLMIQSFNDNSLPLGVMFAIATFLWAALIVYNISYFFQARRVYQGLGGNKMAGREFTRQTASYAYENRDVIAQVVSDNKDTIKRVAVENKDAIVDFAKENRQEITQVAVENKQTVAKVVMDNRDTIWQNQGVVDSVFSDNPQTRGGASSAV